MSCTFKSCKLFSTEVIRFFVWFRCLKMHAIKPSPSKLSCKCFRFRKIGPQNFISADVSGRQERNLQPYIPSTRGAMLCFERCPICIQKAPPPSPNMPIKTTLFVKATQNKWHQSLKRRSKYHIRGEFCILAALCLDAARPGGCTHHLSIDTSSIHRWGVHSYYKLSRHRFHQASLQRWWRRLKIAAATLGTQESAFSFLFFFLLKTIIKEALPFPVSPFRSTVRYLTHANSKDPCDLRRHE